MTQAFQNEEFLKEIRRKCHVSEVLISWLSYSPKYTTFRINKLRNVNLQSLNLYLKSQSSRLGTEAIPKYYHLRPDCLVLEQWPAEVSCQSSGKQVIVDAACAAAVLRGAHVFAPGVMGLPTNCQLDDIVDIYGDMDGKCKKGLKVEYDGAKKLVGTGQLKMLRHNLYGDGIIPSGIAVHTILPVSRLPVVNETLYPTGDILLQNLPSLVCGWVLDAQPDEYILDMCAAPGNKTTHLAEMSNNQAHIIAIDKSIQKVERITVNATAHGITCINSYVYDSTKIYSDSSKGVTDGPPYPENCFDKILLDVPCSGLGQRPLILNKMTPKMLSSYKFVQRKLMKAAVRILKVGGRLVYSTCTITEDENEGMVAWTLEQFPCMRLVAAEPLMGGPGWSDCGLSEEQRILVQRFGPENDPLRQVDPIFCDTIGFFIACFEKICDL